MTNNNDSNVLKDIFLNELATIDTNIGRYDTHSLIIKGWAISLWAGLVYFAIRESAYLLFAVQIVALIIFWLFDALYKYYQRRFAIRSEKILTFLKDYIIVQKDNNLEFKKKTQNDEEKNKNDKEEDTIQDKDKIEEPIEDKIQLVIHREESPMKISENENKLKSLNRCFILRAVSTVYLYLISSSFLIALFISVPDVICRRWWIFGFSLEIMVFAVFNYIFGYDNAIAGYINKRKKESKKFKWFFNLFRWATFIIIGINFIFLICELYSMSIV